jgi:thiol-disulfide isomerase/thioredoxin
MIKPRYVLLTVILTISVWYILSGLEIKLHRDSSVYQYNPPTIETVNLDFKNMGKAPDFIGIEHWLNSSPLTMQNLKGKVVLVDFWTYSCINCIHTLPYVTKWYDTYKDKGFVVIGVHTPEFSFEKETKNVQDAIGHFKIHYPVAQDNDNATWNNFHNHYWPAEYLIDKNGEIVYQYFGEGNYDETEKAIRSQLGLGTETTLKKETT